MILTLVSIHV